MARDKQRDSDQSTDGIRLGRRSYLKMSATAVAAAAAFVGHEQVTSVPKQAAVTVHGYGGRPVVQQHGSQTVNAVSGGSLAQLSVATETEPNDTKATAQRVGVGTSLEATLTPAEVDWYAFEAARGAHVVLELDRAAADGITALILYGPDGDYLNLRYTGSDVPARVDLDSAPTSATYYAQVVDIQEGSGDYTLDVMDGDAVTPTETPTPTPTPTPTETPTPAPVDDTFGKQGYGKYGYGGISS